MIYVENSNRAESVENVKKGGVPVIIFGAGIVGEVLWQACRQAGINVEYFCDNNINKTKSLKCGIQVIHTKNIKTKYKDAIFLISAADIKDVVDQLQAMGFSKWHASSLLLRDFDLSQFKFNAPIDFVEFAVSTCLSCHDSYLSPDKLFMRSVDIIITERCSLKCMDCSNLMQYYKKPKDCDIDEIMQSVDVFCALADEVNEFRVIGGEPFMNKEIHTVIERLIDEPKIRKVVIYTNGTIVPNEEQIERLNNTKVLLIITDYGMLSKNINPLTQILRQNNISHYVTKAQGWADCANLSKHYRNTEQQKEIFTNCCAKNTLTLSKGKLYRCPFAANADRLWAIPDYERDYVNIIQEPLKAMNSHEIKNKIRALLVEKEFLETCDFCNGRPFGAPEIQPAIQTSKPLEYTQCYSR